MGFKMANGVSYSGRQNKDSELCIGILTQGRVNNTAIH